MRNPQMIRIAAGALAIAMMFTTACTPDATTPVTTPVYAKAQFVHVAPEAPGTIVSVDGKKINTDSLTYLQYIDYVDVDVTAAGKRIVKFDSKAGNITTDSIALNQDTYYTFFEYTDSVTAKTRTKIASDNLAAPVTGKSKLRIAHFISDFGANLVHIELVAPGGISTANNHFTGLKFKDVTDFIEIPSGKYDVKSTFGTDYTKFENITFDAGKIYTMVGRGYIYKANLSGAFIINNK
jgi:Domain of unknown function (DUF4397)